jgi:hypothetical protein
VRAEAEDVDTGGDDGYARVMLAGVLSEVVVANDDVVTKTA